MRKAGPKETDTVWEYSPCRRYARNEVYGDRKEKGGCQELRGGETGGYS